MLAANGKQEQQKIDLFQRKFKLVQRKSASMVKIEIENELGISLHLNTIRKRAHEVGPVARKKPYVNKINRRKRIKFAKEMLEKPVDFWKNVVWLDESKFNLFGSDGKVMFWRTPHEEFDPECTIPTIKQSGGSVMIWGCFTRQRVGKLCIVSYHGQILLSRYFGINSATINQSF